MPIQQGVALLFIEVLGAGAGTTLAIYSSIRAAKIRDYVIRHSLAPELTRSNYFRAFDFAGVCAAYQKATGDRSSVWTTYSTGLIGIILFLGSVALVITSGGPPM